MGKLIDAVRARFGERVLDSHERLGDETILVAPGDWLELARFLRDDPEMVFEFLIDLTAVDYKGKTPRFEVVAHLFSLAKRHRLRIKVAIDEGDPRVSTLSDVWKAANWLEREAWDMFGIQFDGHPDLRRILMYPEFEGHPLRKDYPHNRRQPLIPERDPVENPWPARTMR